MKLQFDITYEGQAEPVRVRTKPKHLLAYEADGGNLADGINLTTAFKLAHLASATAEAFEEWIDRVDSIETIAEDDAEVGAGPTTP